MLEASRSNLRLYTLEQVNLNTKYKHCHLHSELLQMTSLHHKLPIHKILQLKYPYTCIDSIFPDMKTLKLLREKLNSL